MVDIHCYSSKDFALVAVNEASEQRIYRIKNSLIAVQDSDLIRYLHRLGLRNPRATELAEILSELHNKGPIFVVGIGQGYAIDSDVREFQGFASTKNHFQEPTTACLEDILLALYRQCRKDFQFGFSTRKGAKILVAPRTRLLVPVEEYYSKGKSDKKRTELNNRVYTALVNKLNERLELSKKAKNYSGIRSILQDPASVIKNTYKKFELKEETAQIVTDYLGADYSFFGSLLLKDTLSDAEKEPKPKTVIHRKREDLQQLLDREFIKQPSIIIKASRLEEIGKLIAKETGCIAAKLRYAPFAVLTGEKKDIERIFDFYEQKLFSRFSRVLQNLLGTDTTFYWNKGVYIPELIAEFTSSNPYKKPLRASQSMWNLEHIGALAAQKISSGENATIGIIDTGVDYNHQELAHLFGTERGWDFIKDDADPFDYNSHGTHVAGIAAGLNTGVANGCTLYSLRVLDENGSGRLSNIIEAVSWAVARHLDVINLSLGSPSPSKLEYQAFVAAKNAGLLIAAAAGNDGYGPSYPAAYDCVMSVAAVDINNEHPEFSNVWDNNCISAPGVSIYSSVPNNGYDSCSGTSMATPHLSGVAAMARSVQPPISQDDFIRILTTTAQKLGSVSNPNNWATYGAGLLRADELVKELYHRGGLIWKRRAIL